MFSPARLNIENGIQIRESDIFGKVEMRIYWNIGTYTTNIWRKYESNNRLAVPAPVATSAR